MRLYKRADSPYWQYSFSINGRRLLGSTRKTAHKDAKLAAIRIYEAEAERRAVDDAWRVRELFGAYIADKGSDKASHAQIFSIFDKLSEHLGDNLPIADITAARLLDYRQKHRGTAKRHTFNRHFAMLRAALNHAAAIYGKPIPHIAWKQLMEKEPPGRIRFATQGEFQRLYASAAPSCFSLSQRA